MTQPSDSPPYDNTSAAVAAALEKLRLGAIEDQHRRELLRVQLIAAVAEEKRARARFEVFTREHTVKEKRERERHELALKIMQELLITGVEHDKIPEKAYSLAEHMMLFRAALLIEEEELAAEAAASQEADAANADAEDTPTP